MHQLRIVPVGSPDLELLAAAADVIPDVFPVEVSIDPIAVDPRPAYDARRDQYSSRDLLAMLLQKVRAPEHVLGVTEMDLFMPILTFVFGEAQLAGRGAIVSTHRLSQTYYGLPESIPLLNDRFLKEVVHELGHTWGLRHCQDYSCAMAASRTADMIDTKEAVFCASCGGHVQRSVEGHTKEPPGSGAGAGRP